MTGQLLTITGICSNRRFDKPNVIHQIHANRNDTNTSACGAAIDCQPCRMSPGLKEDHDRKGYAARPCCDTTVQSQSNHLTFEDSTADPRTSAHSDAHPRPATPCSFYRYNSQADSVGVNCAEFSQSRTQSSQDLDGSKLNCILHQIGDLLQSCSVS